MAIDTYPPTPREGEWPLQRGKWANIEEPFVRNLIHFSMGGKRARMGN